MQALKRIRRALQWLWARWLALFPKERALSVIIRITPPVNPPPPPPGGRKAASQSVTYGEDETVIELETVEGESAEDLLQRAIDSL